MHAHLRLNNGAKTGALHNVRKTLGHRFEMLWWCTRRPDLPRWINAITIRGISRSVGVKGESCLKFAVQNKLAINHKYLARQIERARHKPALIPPTSNTRQTSA